MFSKKVPVVAVASAFALLALPVLAQTASTTGSTTTSSSTSTQAVPTAKLVEQYTDLAGSEKSAKSLVEGLRTKTSITLEPIAKDDKPITFTPPTAKMGNGNINIALAIAERTLANDKNVANQDLYNALMDQKTGVLQMRADGMGWGQIANELGFKLGEVMGKADRSAQTAQGAGSKRETMAQRPDRPARPDRVEKPERPMRPERPERGR